MASDPQLFDPGPKTGPTQEQRELEAEALAITPELWAGVQCDPKALADLIERLVLALPETNDGQ